MLSARSGASNEDRAGVPEGLQKRPQMALVAPPAADRARIERLADLPGAGRDDRTPGFVKGQAAVVPWQAAVVEKPADVAFRIDDWSGTLLTSTDETTDARFCRTDEFPSPLSPTVVETLADLAAFERTGRMVLK